MIFEDVKRFKEGKLSQPEATDILVSGVNDYRDKIVQSCFENGSIKYGEFPYFMAALKLVIEDIEDVVKKNKDDSLFKIKVDAIIGFVRANTLTIKVERKGDNNGNSI